MRKNEERGEFKARPEQELTIQELAEQAVWQEEEAGVAVDEAVVDPPTAVALGQVPEAELSVTANMATAVAENVGANVATTGNVVTEAIVSGEEAAKPKKQRKLSAKQKKVLLIVGCALLVLVVGGSIVTLMLLPKAFKVDYKSVYAKGKDASDAMYGVMAYESCRGVLRSVDSSYTTKKSYNNYVQKCQDNLAILDNAVKELGEEGALASDESLAREWTKFSEVYARAVPFYKKMLTIYPDWHDFSVNVVELTKDSDWWKTATDAGIDAAYAPIVESDNATLSEWGGKKANLYKKYVSAYKAYKEAYDMYYDASYSAPNKMALREDMQVKSAASDEAYEAFKKHDTGNPIVLTDVLGADLMTDDYNMAEYMSDLYDVLHTKYLEAYMEGE